jgi:hypothetical protein
MNEDVTNDHDLLVLIAERTRVTLERAANHDSRIGSLERDRDTHLTATLARVASLETGQDTIFTDIQQIKARAVRATGWFDMWKLAMTVGPVVLGVLGYFVGVTR